MRFYYFNSTHWDREWYQSFQEFRKYLIDTVRGLLKIFEEDPEFTRFTLDGQTIVLEDVCEVLPGLRPELEKLIRENKLNVGPWYVMPDEFLVSGEALIRNLLAGKRVASEFGGKSWPVGYVCDIFGHIAQLPQIFSGFGLDNAVIWRGTPDMGNQHFLLWESPDGSRIKVLNLPKSNGYGNFTLQVRGKYPVALEEKLFKEKLHAFISENKDQWQDVFLLTDAFDHTIPAAETSKMLKWIQEAYPEAELIHTDYTELFDREFILPGLPVIYGEQIHPAAAAENGGLQISGTLSSRYDLKRANDLCQNELELLIEPELAVRLAYGEKDSLPFLDYNWKHLLQNHAHDSICGCSIDQVHRMMLGRFEEVRSLSRTLDEEFFIEDWERTTGKTFYSALNTGAILTGETEDDGCYSVRIFNPLPFAQARQVELQLPFMAHDKIPYPKRQAEPFGYEYLNSFRLYDQDDREIPYQIKRVRKNQTKIIYRQDHCTCDIYEVVCPLRLPAASWTSLRLRPSDNFVRRFDSLLTGARSAENEFLRLEINPDGTFNVTDKRSGRVYEKLNDFSIDREIGDGWNHVSPAGCRRITGSSDAQLAVIMDGPEQVEFEIRKSYHLAKRLSFDGTLSEAYAGISESPEIEELKIIINITLNKGSDILQCKTTVFNNIQDYRLQMLLPTGINGDYFAGQAFTMQTRPAGRSWGKNTENFAEAEVIEKNFDGIIGKKNKTGGMAFLSAAGLHEAGALADAADTLVITLLRAFRRTYLTNGEPEGELQGTLQYDYALSFFAAGTSSAELFRQVQCLRSPLPHYMLRTNKIISDASHTFIKLSGDIVFSCLKPAEDLSGVILRVFNPEKKSVKATVELGRVAKRILRCRLDESGEKEIDSNINAFDIQAGAGEIITFKLEF
jgi:alpha-mannosidase